MDALKNFNLLLVEDNEEFACNTIETLDIFFQNVFHAKGIQEALDIHTHKHIDVIISDIKLEDGNGLEFVKRVRSKDLNVVILILSAHKDEEFLFAAIPLNILSYELKPMSYKHFLEMLQKISKKFDSKKVYQFSNSLEYRFASKSLYENQKVIKLTNKEILFVELFVRYKNQIITYEMIQKDVYQEKVMTGAAMKNFVLRLRKKVKVNFISSVSNLGYKLKEDIKDV